MNETILTSKELSSRGGKSCFNRHGSKQYSDMGKKGAEGRMKKYGKDYYRRLSIAGLAARHKRGLITKDTLDKAVAKINAKYDSLE